MNLLNLASAQRTGVALCLALAIGWRLVFDGSMLLNDPDTYWHIAVGKGIWTSGTLPRTDTLSHTFAGQPWIAKEWLSQIMLGLAHDHGGWRGVVALTAAAAALSFGLLAYVLGRYLPPLLVLLVAGLGFVICGDTLLARPHVIVLPVVVLWITVLADAADRGATPPWWLLPVMTLWANMHAGFSFGIVIACAIAADIVWSAPASRRLRQMGLWAVFVLAALTASCLSPYGVQSMQVALTLLRGAESMRYIVEWQPLALDFKGLTILAFAAGLVLLLALDPVRNLPRILLVLLLTYMMVKHIRFTLLFVFVVPVIAARPLGPLLARFIGDDSAKAGVVVSARPWLTAAAFLLGLTVATLALREPVPDPAKSPVAALAAAATRVRPGPVYNSYPFGGFLIANGVKTFIDGRSDQLFLGGFMDSVEKATLSADPAELETLVARHGVTWSLLRTGSPEAAQFTRMPSWRLVWADSVAEVFSRE